ncbi:MAG: resolvase [Calditrichaeota bacterium]|nr:MAG: resolvase [Calditrichota bacterium]
MIYGYIRVSTDKQNLSNQLFEIVDYCKAKSLDLKTSNVYQEVISTQKEKKERKQLVLLLNSIQENDTLVVSELSRMGRDTIEVLQTIQELLRKDIELRLIKENLVINGADSITAKLLIPMLSAINDLERQRISERTKQALATKKAQGIKLGRPKGSTSKSKLDPHTETIEELLKKEVSIQAIAKIIGTSRQNLHRFIRVRKIKEKIRKK